MKNYKTVRVMYGKGLKNRIADYLHRHNLVKVIYQIPIIGDDGAEIGSVCTMTGNSKALWLMSKLFKKEVAIQPFALNGEKWFEEA